VPAERFESAALQLERWPNQSVVGKKTSAGRSARLDANPGSDVEFVESAAAIAGAIGSGELLFSMGKGGKFNGFQEDNF